MNLNQNIDLASKFQPEVNTGAPVVDQSANASFAINLAQRQAADKAAQPAPEPIRSLGAMPYPN